MAGILSFHFEDLTQDEVDDMQRHLNQIARAHWQVAKHDLTVGDDAFGEMCMAIATGQAAVVVLSEADRNWFIVSSEVQPKVPGLSVIPRYIAMQLRLLDDVREAQDPSLLGKHKFRIAVRDADAEESDADDADDEIDVDNIFDADTDIYLDPDVAEFFPDSRSVNKALRALIEIAREHAGAK